MKRIILTLAAVTAIAVSCNLNIDSDEDVKKAQQPVDFNAYLNRGVTTKAGQAGDLTTTTLQNATAGFGVFAYYTADEPYTEAARPNFMYNEKVTYDNGNWVYNPIKYWPNEFGAAAASDEVDRLSFFAYAPYVEVNAANGAVTGDATCGIIALSRNTASGDPLVKYMVDLDPSSGVDLCWGVAKDDFNESVDGNNNHVAKGAPYIDVIKPKKDAKIDFDFHHALAGLNVQIDAVVDATTPGTDVDANTRIYVRSVSFEGLATKGALNLNSNTTNGPSWTDVLGSGAPLTETLTVYDGRRNGKEGVDGAIARNETPTGLNPKLIQTQPYTSATLEPGVTKTAVNLFNSTEETASVYVIPTSEPLKVTIVYDVETKDDKLSTVLSDGVTHGSTVENVISKTIQITSGTTTSDLTLQAGKKYTLALHLGITSVKFVATVADWGTGDNAGMDLPKNE